MTDLTYVFPSYNQGVLRGKAQHFVFIAAVVGRANNSESTIVTVLN